MWTLYFDANLDKQEGAPMIMASNGVDRRKHERFPIKQSTVAFKAAGLLSSLSRNQSTGNLLVNMGAGGAQFIIPEPIRPGAKLNLTIAIPAFVEKLHLTAEVIWCSRLQGARSYRAGVKFLRAGKDTWQKVETLRSDVFFRTNGGKERMKGKVRAT
jgi:hypothetical protein